MSDSVVHCLRLHVDGNLLTVQPKINCSPFQVNGVQETPQEYVPTHQYSASSQASHAPQTLTDHIPVIPEIPMTLPVSTPRVNQPVPQTLPTIQNINPMLNSTLQNNINLTTPLQIATDSTPVLGLSQVGTPRGGELGPGVSLPMGVDPVLRFSAQQNLAPAPGVTDSVTNAENIQRMLLKQNIMK